MAGFGLKLIMLSFLLTYFTSSVKFQFTFCTIKYDIELKFTKSFRNKENVNV